MRIQIVMGIILWMLSPLLVYGQLANPVRFQIDTLKTAESAAAGTAIPVTVNATIDNGWHLYSILNNPASGPIPTSFSSDNEKMIIAGDLTESEADIVYDPNFNAKLGWHSQNATFIVPVLFDSSLSGSHEIELKVYYQVCDDVSCLPPVTRLISADIRINESGTPAGRIEFSGNDYGTGTTADAQSTPSRHGSSQPYLVILLFTVLLTGLLWYFIRSKLLQNSEDQK